MLGEYHDEALEDDEEQVLLVGLRRLQQILQLLNLHHTHSMNLWVSIQGCWIRYLKKPWVRIHCFIIQKLSDCSEA